MATVMLPLMVVGVLGLLVLAPAVGLFGLSIWLRGARVVTGVHRWLADVLLDTPVRRRVGRGGAGGCVAGSRRR